MAMNGASEEFSDSAVSAALTALADLEKDFAAVELDALRQKEFSSRELYSSRSKHLLAIPNFWATVLTYGPTDLTDLFTETDADILTSITDLRIERHQIKSDTEGEPRSLRFTFTFDPSKQKTKLFEDTTVTKDFEFIAREDVDGGGGYVSKPMNFTWTKAGKKKGVNKMLDLAEQLYQAEQTLTSGQKGGEIEQKERESLWQYEKLREELEKEEEAAMNGEDSDGRSFLEWFGYRGAVGTGAAPEKAKKETNGNTEEMDEDDDEEEEVDEEDGLLEVEIFPAGADVALALAEDLWPNVMDYFMKAQAEDDLEDLDDLLDEDEEDGAPELVEFAGFEDADAAEEEDNGRPAKKQRRS